MILYNWVNSNNAMGEISILDSTLVQVRTNSSSRLGRTPSKGFKFVEFDHSGTSHRFEACDFMKVVCIAIHLTHFRCTRIIYLPTCTEVSILG